VLFRSGGDVTISYFADPGHHFTSVAFTTGGSTTTDTGAKYTKTVYGVTNDIEFSVLFGIDTFNVEVTVKNGTTTFANGVYTYVLSPLTIEYSANEGYEFAGVYVNGVRDSSAVSDTLYAIPTIEQNYVITVEFVPSILTVTTNVIGGTIDDSATVEYNGNITVHYAPTTGYHLVSVTVTTGGTLTDVTASNPSSYAITGATDNYQIEVVYQINTYTVDVAVNNGTLTSGDGPYNYGDAASIIYSGLPGYVFSGVYVNGVRDSSAVSDTLYAIPTIEQNYVITVEFVPSTITITATATNGTVTGGPTITAAYGSSVTINYLSNTGFHFVSATVDAVPVSAGVSSYTFVATEDVTFDVLFELNTYTITKYVSGLTPSPTLTTTTVGYGSDGYVEYPAVTGYHLVSVLVDHSAVSISSGTVYTFIEVTADHIIDITYAPDEHTVNASVVNGTINGGGSYRHGYPATISYAPTDGYHLVSVALDGVVFTSPSTEITIPSVINDHTIAVVYEIDVFEIVTFSEYAYFENVNVEYGHDITVSYTLDRGFHVGGVFVDDTQIEGELPGVSSGSYTFIGVTEDGHHIEVNCVEDEYIIFADAINGTINGGTSYADLTAHYGETVTINYSGVAGAYLASLEVDNRSMDPSVFPSSYTFDDVTENHTLSVTFINQYTVTYKYDDLTVYTETVKDGDHVRLINGSEPGKLFLGWLNGSDLLAAGGLYTPYENTELIASFVDVHTVNVQYFGIEYNVTVTHGETFTPPVITPPTGFTFDGWYIGDDEVTSTVVLGDVTVVGKFTVVPPESNTITYVVLGGLGGTVAGTNAVVTGEYGVFIITPEAGYGINDVSVSSGTAEMLTERIYRILVDDDVIVTVTFVEITGAADLTFTVKNDIKEGSVKGITATLRSDDERFLPDFGTYGGKLTLTVSLAYSNSGTPTSATRTVDIEVPVGQTTVSVSYWLEGSDLAIRGNVTQISFAFAEFIYTDGGVGITEHTDTIVGA
jgi:hypothetical protein